MATIRMHSPTIFEADIEDGTLRAGSMSVSVPEDENWRTTRVQPYVSRTFENRAITSSAHGVTAKCHAWSLAGCQHGYGTS